MELDLFWQDILAWHGALFWQEVLVHHGQLSFGKRLWQCKSFWQGFYCLPSNWGKYPMAFQSLPNFKWYHEWGCHLVMMGQAWIP